MRVAAITTLIGLANVCDQRLGVLELDLEGRKQCVLSFDREHLITHLEFQPDHIRSHGSSLDPSSNRTLSGAPLKQQATMKRPRTLAAPQPLERLVGRRHHSTTAKQ